MLIQRFWEFSRFCCLVSLKVILVNCYKHSMVLLWWVFFFFVIWFRGFFVYLVGVGGGVCFGVWFCFALAESVVLVVPNKVRKVGVLCSSATYIISGVDIGTWKFHELPRVFKSENKFLKLNKGNFLVLPGIYPLTNCGFRKEL